MTAADQLAAADQATAEPAAAVSLRGLRKVFGPVVAVDGIDLDVADGEFFAMLGPSGSGKTTVLRMIAGFETPTAGTVHLAGADATRTPPFRRDVNTVFQDYALFPHMSVEQNVAYGLRVKGVPRAQRATAVGAALEMVRLAGMGSRRPSQLSGGQRQRVALARALVNRPRVLLLDEPLGALDLKLREQMQLELKSIQRDVGITFLFVTHDQDEALTLCDRLAVFCDGRIEQVGAAADVYENPRTRFVAEFVGTSNVIAGEAAHTLLGSDTTVAVRPERIRLAPVGTAAGTGEIAVDGVIAEVVYAGSQTRIVADVPGGLRITAVTLNADTSIAAPHRGDRVTLCWPRTAQRVLSA